MNELEENCPFCLLDKIDFVAGSRGAIAFYDKFPVSKGHTLVVPARHVSNYFDLSAEEQCELWDLVNRCKGILDEEFHPDGYNVGFNCKESAGQSIGHVHIHIIPRYKGDMENPKGGERGNTE